MEIKIDIQQLLLGIRDYIANVVSLKVDKEEGKGLFSGSYNDLADKPTIPSNIKIIDLLDS